MIDIAKQHRASGSPRILAKFFTSKGYSQAAEYLIHDGLRTQEIRDPQNAFRGQPGIEKVHPLIALEYARWVDYDAYAKLVIRKLK